MTPRHRSTRRPPAALRGFIRGLSGALAGIALAACSPQPDPAAVAGRYEWFNDLRPHAAAVVRLDVYEDFTCPACQRFTDDTLPALRATYGDRIEVHPHYLVGSRSPVSAQVLYQVAAGRGAGEEAARRLFAARLDHHDAARNLPVVKAIASVMGLHGALDDALRAPSTRGRIRAAWETEGAAIRFFPSVVIQHRLLTDGNPDNLRTIIDSLLAPPPAENAHRSLVADRPVSSDARPSLPQGSLRPPRNPAQSRAGVARRAMQ